jgi:hypothetical protein
VLRYATERKAVEEELMKHREHLGGPVKEPKTGLRMADEQLQKAMTARKRAKQAIQEASEYAESIIETVREPLVVLEDFTFFKSRSVRISILCGWRMAK